MSLLVSFSLLGFEISPGYLKNSFNGFFPPLLLIPWPLALKTNKQQQKTPARYWFFKGEKSRVTKTKLGFASIFKTTVKQQDSREYI